MPSLAARSTAPGGRAGRAPLRDPPANGSTGIHAGWPRLWLLVSSFVQLAIVLWGIFDGGDLWSAPIRNDDSAGHFYSAVHAGEHFRRSGTIWGYDPFWLAGYPEGGLGLVDNKLFSVVVALVPEGAKAAVYNTVFLIAVLLPPWLLYGAARAGGATPMAGAGAAVAAPIATFTIPLTFGFLMWGGTSFFLASVMVVPATVLLAVRIASGTLWSGRGAAALALAAGVLFIHPAVLPILAAGLLPGLVAGRRRGVLLLLDLTLVGIAVGAAFLPLVDAYLELRAQFRIHYAPGAMFLRDIGHGSMAGGLSQLVEDWWTYLFEIDRWPHGAGGLLGLLLLALSSIRQAGGERGGALGLRVAFLAAAAAAFMAYGASSLVPRAAVGQPHRYMVLLGFFLCLPAGEALGRFLRRPKVLTGHGLLVVVSLAIAIRAGFGLVPSLAFGAGWDPAEEALVDFLAREGDGRGRTLVESTFRPLPASQGSERTIPVKRFALLPLRTGREHLGYYFTGAHSVQRYASFGRGGILGAVLAELSDEQARELFSRFAVTRIVACTPPSVRHLVRLRGAVEPGRSVGDCWMFRARAAEPSRVLEGRGTVRARLDRIEVRNADGERIVLKYHWMPTLRVEPPLPLEEAPQPGAPVGFVAVRPGGIRDFAVVQKRTLDPIERLVGALRVRFLPRGLPGP